MVPVQYFENEKYNVMDMRETTFATKADVDLSPRARVIVGHLYQRLTQVPPTNDAYEVPLLRLLDKDRALGECLFPSDSFVVKILDDLDRLGVKSLPGLFRVGDA